MRKIIGTLLVLAVLGVAGAAAFIYSGAYNIAADDPHWPVTYRLMQTARDRSIKAHAAGIAPPADLGTEARVVAGTSHFSEHCSTCHSAPGVEAEDLAEGMYPKPPVLTNVASRFTPGELFWILKNGIKMSGMPSWADHGDDELWNAVAFLEKLPGMTPEQYGKLVVAAQAAGGHHMHGGAGDGQMGMSMPGMDMSGHATGGQQGTSASPAREEPKHP
jgi:mono/diheme cytochrome c family protein